ncbi:hypothetical protein [Desulfonema magnum]|uniref:hypothetical protein n=1 Tax=Desulfonema magnum TaxID=45655 RepID=UPI001A9A93DE|nr:hypothetical protein [Desulfonema magnum]
MEMTNLSGTKNDTVPVGQTKEYTYTKSGGGTKIELSVLIRNASTDGKVLASTLDQPDSNTLPQVTFLPWEDDLPVKASLMKQSNYVWGVALGAV